DRGQPGRLLLVAAGGPTVLLLGSPLVGERLLVGGGALDPVRDRPAERLDGMVDAVAAGGGLAHGPLDGIELSRPGRQQQRGGEAAAGLDGLGMGGLRGVAVLTAGAAVRPGLVVAVLGVLGPQDGVGD